MSNLIKFPSAFIPEEGVKLPVELKNSKGENIACIYRRDSDAKFYGYINSNDVNSSGFSTLTECLEATFAKIYQQMQEYRKEAEKGWRLRDALKETLKTPWNNL